MHGVTHALQVVERVVQLVPVAMVDVVAAWNWAMLRNPDQPMLVLVAPVHKAHAVAVFIPALSIRSPRFIGRVSVPTPSNPVHLAPATSGGDAATPGNAAQIHGSTYGKRAKPASLFVWKKEPRQEWLEALERIAPRNEQIPWLHIYFEPGETWDPVQRWMIREMDPGLQFYDAEEIAMYRGPSPRTMGYWAIDGTNRRWKSEAPPGFSLRKWELFRQYQCMSRRVWVVQGPDGGHPFELSQAEQAFLQAAGLPGSDTPAPGALPYSEPDARTWTRLAEYDRLRKWEDAITWNERRENKTNAGLVVRRNIQEEYQKFGVAMLNFFTEGLKEAIDSVPRGTLEKLYDAAPKTEHGAPLEDYEEIERRFVEASPVSMRTD